MSTTTATATPAPATSYFTKDATGQIGGKIQLVPNPGRIETINHAMNAYGHLINCNERLTPMEFAERICAAYDCKTNQQNSAVVDALNYLI